MKKILFVLFLLTMPVLLQAEEPVREWTSKDGKKVYATFDVENDSDPETVHFLKDGKRFKFSFKELSQADQDYIKKARTTKNDFILVKKGYKKKTVTSGKRYALLIGVNKYATPFKSLQFCVNDMELLAECFQKAGMSEENIILVTDNSSDKRRPTSKNIRRQIEIITSLMEPEDQLIIAFSGHGAMVDGKSYLCPSDTNLNDKNSIVSRDWVFEQLEMCKAKQKVFLVDACRNEISEDGKKEIGQAQTLDDPIGADTHGFILIASCDKKQQSWEHSDIQHGVFTYYFAEGLSGKAKDEEDCITIMGLFQYASFKTKMFVFHKFNEAQVPTFRQGDEMTDFCLAKMSDIVLNDSHAPVEPEPPKLSLVHLPSKPYKIGDRLVYKIGDVEFAFRYCPPGTFIMGSPESEEGREDDETQHQVTLTKGFWMMETELSQKQWKAVISYLPIHEYFRDDDIPVSGLWIDGQEFCKKCAELGLPVQLPTEAQWEYACRAGTTGPFAGNLDEIAWYSSQKLKPYPVGSKKPNAWGLHDMHGNVEEWCQDLYESYPSGRVIDPTGPSEAEYRKRFDDEDEEYDPKHVFRSSRHQTWEGYGRSAYRGRYGDKHYKAGYRLMLPLSVTDK